MKKIKEKRTEKLWRLINEKVKNWRKTKKSNPWVTGCLSIIIIFLVIAGLSIYGVFSFFTKESKKENTKILINKAPQILNKYSGLDMPSNAEVKYVSIRSLGPNSSTELILYLDNLNLFINVVQKKYTLEECTWWIFINWTNFTGGFLFN